MYCDLSGVGVGLGSAKSERSIANANDTMQMTTLIITLSKVGADYRRTTSRATDWAASPVRVRSAACLAVVSFHYLTCPMESERVRKRKFDLFSSVQLVEREVQLQNIDSGVTEYAEITPIGVLLDESANFVFAQCPSFSDTRDLEFGVT